MSFVNHYLSYFRQLLICHLLSAGHFCRLCYLKVHTGSCPTPFSVVNTCQPAAPAGSVIWKIMQGATPPLLSGVLKGPHPLCCVPFLLPCLLFSGLFCFVLFLQGGGSVCPGGYAGISQGWLWECCVPLICSPVDLRLPSRFGASIWQHRSPPVFSMQCGMERLCTGWGFGVSESHLFLVFSFSSAKCGSSFSGQFLIHGAHVVCFLPLVTILDPPHHIWKAS
jgi:hypothetical protein